MDIRNCAKCRQVFNYVNSSLCPTCTKEEEEIFESVRKYIIDNPKCTMIEVAEATEVSVKKITKYIKDGRIEISQGMHGELECELCGVPISKGKFCDSCVVKIGQDMSSAFSQKKKPAAAMHTHHRR